MSFGVSSFAMHGLSSCVSQTSERASELSDFSNCGNMWDLSSPTRDQTLVPCIAVQILNHWEVPTRTSLDCHSMSLHFSLM